MSGTRARNNSKVLANAASPPPTHRHLVHSHTQVPLRGIGRMSQSWRLDDDDAGNFFFVLDISFVDERAWVQLLLT